MTPALLLQTICVFGQSRTCTPGTFQLLPAPQARGIVQDEYGMPIAGARISLQGTLFSVQTGEDGLFAISFFSENARLVIHAPETDTCLLSLQETATPLTVTLVRSSPGTLFFHRAIPTWSPDTGPLIILDGQLFKGTLGDIDPANVRSAKVMPVIKARVLYGARAMNGVLQIRTHYTFWEWLIRLFAKNDKS